MILVRAYKTELGPNNRVRTHLLKHAGARRWAFNWGLRRKIEEYEKTGKSPHARALHRELHRLKKTDPDGGGVPRMYEVSKCAPQEALRDLDRAFVNFIPASYGRREARVPALQVEEARHRRIPADGDDPGLRAPRPASSPRQDPAQGARLSAV